jgi:hypothetical protein
MEDMKADETIHTVLVTEVTVRPVLWLDFMEKERKRLE